MEATKERQESSGGGPVKAVDLITLWADTNRKVLREIADLALTVATEGMRLSSALQVSALEVAKDGQAFWTRRLGSPAEWPKDPMAWSQQATLEGIQEGRKAISRLEANGKALAESAGKLAGAVEQAAEKIQQTLTSLAGEIKGLYAPING